MHTQHRVEEAWLLGAKAACTDIFRRAAGRMWPTTYNLHMYITRVTSERGKPGYNREFFKEIAITTEKYIINN